MPSDKKDDDNKKNDREKRILLIFGIVALIFTLTLNYVISKRQMQSVNEVKYSEFIDMVKEGKVDEVEFSGSVINFTLKEDKADQFGNKSKYYTGYINDPNLISRLEENDVAFDNPPTTSSPIISFVVEWVLPIAFFYLMISLLMRSMMKRMGGGFGKSNAKMYVEKETGITFADVAGEEEAKESLTEIVDFLHQPEKYTQIGAKLPRGALLVGPPGTGKTLLAKAVAGEAKVPFYSLSGSNFVEMFVGVGASRVRDLFKDAVANAPCIIFIDEIDAIGKSRDGTIGNDEREQTLNQLLSEMDGFDVTKGIVVIGATNRPEVLDQALLRPGRFDRRIVVDKPDLKGREDILKVHLKAVKTDDDIDLKQIALGTSGCAGADIANMVNEAALLAVREGRDKVRQSDLMEAIELVIAGKEKKDRILTEKERKIVAYHEVGHALAIALQKNTQPVQKITIVPRTMGSLGYTMQMPEEEHYLMSKEEITEQIVTLLSGRTAEEIIFNTVTTGAANDIERATELARAMVTKFGMSESFDMMALEKNSNMYLEGKTAMLCSDATGSKADYEALEIIKDCHKKATELLSANIDKLHKIAAFLIEKETITGEQFMELFNEKDEQSEENNITEE
ncbi:ATP-dependent zinc metalloprotease FtsH [Anaerotignum sp. MSJ-24]|uniref:ATP-dependent zinc metalloprotease FtsH n=1 Tax=Anaerotignum sp. MSJ-24 TaxID=2841521 RepID=UPI001C111CC2|nr:ATP-dependent zinc metalloprotease FtsH [Anaerotignum sp. MSJ-24]MBU5464307.1 ATP-dependent zinc metalloprotease FtsH [Anaerotignum sp. MSJ-24]